jgi:hypothetical protein
MCSSQQMLEQNGRFFTSWLLPSRGSMSLTPFSRAMILGAARPWYCAAGRVEPAHLYTKPSTTPPARAWAERHHPGVVGEPAAGCIPSVRTPRGWLGPARGQKSVGFCPLGGAHQSAWSLYIMLGHTPRRRCPAGA